MKSVLCGIGLAIGLALWCASPSQAATISNFDNGRTLVDASKGTSLIGGGTWLNGPDVVTGSVKRQYRSTFENGDGTFASSSDASASYFRVHDGATAVLKVARSKALSLLWGSVDSYNKITLQDTLTGRSLVLTLGSLKGAVVGLGASLVNVTGFAFDRVEFWSSGNSLEFSNISTQALAPVPVPAPALLLIGGLGGLAALRRRRPGRACSATHDA